MQYNKKKSKGSSNQKNILKQIYNKSKLKTQPSPQHNSVNKQKIKSALKIYTNTNNNTSNIHSNNNNITNNNNQIKNNYRSNTSNYQRQDNTRTKIKSKLDINVPYIRTTLTPKSFNQNNQSNQSKVHSTKNKDNQKFMATGRLDFRNYFQKKKMSKSKELQRNYSRQANRRKISPRAVQSSLNHQNNNKDDQSTIKFIQPKDDDFDVKAYLTPEQYQKFGDRFPQKFKRVALLGRGGFSVVWLGVHRTSKKKVAIKQILTRNPHETHMKQIWFGSYFFQKGGQPRQQFQNHIGINNICKLYYHQIKTLDTWLYYQVCEQSLGSSLFQLKGQTVNGQRSYRMYYKPLLMQIKSNCDELKSLVIEISKALYLMNSHNIVHSDLKTQNILIRVRSKNDPQSSGYVKNLKLIDFGSSFLFTNLKQFSMATPEYMPPEILNYILFQNKLQYDEQMLKKMQKYLNPWVVDIWSLGLPLWMSIPTQISGHQQKYLGLFAVKGRLFNKIISKQIDVVQNLEYNLKHKNYSGIKIDEQFKKVLQRMLSLQPEDRISPMEILNHFGVPCKPQRIPFY